MAYQVPMDQLPGNLPLGGEFFTYALPWLLTFAIVYGFLQHVEIPKSSSARAVISLVLAFFVMPVAAPIVGFLQGIGTSLILVITGVLFFLVLLELTQTEKYPQERVEGIDPETREKVEGLPPGAESKKLTEEHTREFGVIVFIILGVIFWGAGGFDALGVGNFVPAIDLTTLFFLAVLSLAIIWMVYKD